MEQTIEINECKTEQKPGMLRAAADCDETVVSTGPTAQALMEALLANLPIIICGLVIFLAIAREFVL